MPSLSQLSQNQLEQYRRDGVLVLPDFYSAEEIAKLRARMQDMVDEFDPSTVSTVFSTTDREQIRNAYFLESGDSIGYFFEEGAFDDDGNLAVPKEQSLNKVGHAMHDLDPVFSEFSRKPELAAVASDIGYQDPKLLQSMYIFKQPRIGGEVVWHTDHPFLWTDPVSVTGFWVALEDATRENGCLWCLPGQHKLAPKERFRRDGDAGSTYMEILDETPFDVSAAQALEAEAGTLVVLNGLLPHWSAPNTSEKSRHAFTLHIIEGTADYPADNWLQRGPGMPLQGFDTVNA